MSSLAMCLKKQQEEQYEAITAAADIEAKFGSAQEKYETPPFMHGFDAQTHVPKDQRTAGTHLSERHRIGFVAGCSDRVSPFVSSLSMFSCATRNVKLNGIVAEKDRCITALRELQPE